MELFCILLIVSFICSLIFCTVGKIPFGKAFFLGVVCVVYAAVVYLGAGIFMLIFTRRLIKGATADIILCLLFFGTIVWAVRDILRSEKMLNVEIGQHLPRMRMLVEDISHFLPRYHRVLNIYYDKEERAIMAWMYVINGKEQQERYERMDNDASISTTDFTKFFFDEDYTCSKEGVYCLSALYHGGELDDVSGTLSYKTPFIFCNGESFSALAHDMKKRYPNEFKMDARNKMWFTLTFRA